MKYPHPILLHSLTSSQIEDKDYLEMAAVRALQEMKTPVAFSAVEDEIYTSPPTTDFEKPSVLNLSPRSKSKKKEKASKEKVHMVYKSEGTKGVFKRCPM